MPDEPDVSTAEELELREMDVPWPDSKEELMDYIDTLIGRNHTYGTCVYAMSMSAVATFRYVSSELGVTGFQASCADLDILRRTRRLEHGFTLLDFGKLLFPQYWAEDHFPSPETLVEDNMEHLQEAAQERLDDNGEKMHPNVRSHLQTIASGEVPQPSNNHPDHAHS